MKENKEITGQFSVKGKKIRNEGEDRQEISPVQVADAKDFGCIK